jgi:hypothetical protein
LGCNAVPQIDFKNILQTSETKKFKFPSDFEAEVRTAGVVLIRNVVQEEEALKWKEDIKNYISRHSGQIAGFPGEFCKITKFSQVAQLQKMSI